VEDTVEHFVGEDLEGLGLADRAFAIVLDGAEIVDGQWVVTQRFGEDVGGGDGILKGDVNADASDGGHGMCGVADAEESGDTPVAEAVDLDGEELDLVPWIELGCAAFKEWDDSDETFVEGIEAAGLDIGEGTFGNDVADLEVVDAVDEDDQAAVVHVA
jgi:hypothetical protein